jgi:hypothetical protein
MSLIDRTLDGFGQDYFKANAYLVGNTDYANYRTNGDNDQVQLQQAVDQVVANLASNVATATTLPTQIRIISNLNVQFNSALTETVGSDTRRLAVQLKDNVQIIITAGCTISFPSGGNSGFSGGSAFTSVFGNFGNLTGASVICEGLNAFDGGSTTAGTATNRHSAIWLDARSNSCTTLTRNNFVITGRKCAGELIRTYNSNSAGTSVALNNNFDILDSNANLGAALIEKNGNGINVTVRNSQSEIQDGVTYKDGVLDSQIDIKNMKQAGTNGLKIFITPTASALTFNDVTVKSCNITQSGEHNVYVAGMNGSFESPNCSLAQKAGMYFDTVLLTGTYYYPKKIVISNPVCNNNNQSASTFGGIQGVVKNLEIIGVQASDTQNVATQYRGIDFSDSKNDYINITSGKAENNTNAQISVFGVNSQVGNDVVGFTNIVDFGASTTRSIDGPQKIWILRNASILKLPKFSDLTINKEYIIKCISGEGEIQPTQEDDLSYKQIDALSAGSFFKIGVNQSIRLIKFSDRWRSTGNSHSQLSVLNVTGTTTIASGNVLVQITGGSDYTITLPDTNLVLGQPVKLKKISKDFNVITFARAGSDVIEAYTVHLTTPTATSGQLTIPDETLELLPVQAGIWRRGDNSRPLESLRSNAYRAGTNQAVAGSASVPVQFNAFYQDKIDTIDTNFGHLLTGNFWWVAPVAGDVYVNWIVEGTLAAGATSFSTVCKISRDSGATFPDNVSPGGTVSLAVGANQISKGDGVLKVNKGDILQITINNLTATAMAVVFNTPTLANRVPPYSSFFNVRYTETNY